MESKDTIHIEAVIKVPIAKVWSYWSEPEHIKQWNNASLDWHTSHAENDLRPGGTFNARMEARDGSSGFEFGGVYDEVKFHKKIAYTLGDGRRVDIDFVDNGKTTKIVEIFEPENTNSKEMQKNGWQAILDNFKKYVELN